jgi:hypothetical protein
MIMPSDQHFFNRAPQIVMGKTEATTRLTNPMKDQAKRLREQAYHSGRVATADAVPSGQPQGVVAGILQQYSQQTPFHLNLRENSPQVNAAMLQPPQASLQQMPRDEREALARVFLSIASKIASKSDFGGVSLVGTKLRGYLPAEVVQHYRYLKGEF